MARRINDVDSDVVPKTGGGSGGDGNATLLLLLHPVHDSSAIMHFTHLMRSTGVVEDALSSSGLTGIDVGHDADVPVFLELDFSRHRLLQSEQKRTRPSGSRSGTPIN